MTLLDNYFPFDQGLGATATPANWRQMARLWYGSGVVPGNGTQFAATISAGVVTIQPGAVWIDGFYGSTTVNKTVSSVGLGAGLIIARMDLNARTITFQYLPGGSVTVNPPGFGQSPLASTYDVPLWYVTTATAITDVRQFCNASPEKIARGRIHRNAAYSTSTTATTFGFDTVDYGSNWSAYTFICPYAADYLCYAQVGFATSAANQWYNVRLLHNSAAVAWNGTPDSTIANAAYVAQVTDVIPCKAGDTLAVQHQCSTAGLAGYVGIQVCYFTVRAMT